MPTMSSVQEWAKTELKEMDAKVTTIQDKLGQLQGDARAKAESTLSGMRRNRDAFREILKKEGEATQAHVTHTRAELETHLSEFKEHARKVVPHTDGGTTQEDATANDGSRPTEDAGGGGL